MEQIVYLLPFYREANRVPKDADFVKKKGFTFRMVIVYLRRKKIEVDSDCLFW
jgi:hypothetical protein